jgi:hypothetical protein
MARIVDLPGLLEALRPEVERRSRTLRGPVEITLESPIGSAIVTAQPGSVSLGAEGFRARLTPGGLAALLLGFLSAVELAEQGEIEAEPAALQPLDVLFPHLHSHYSQIDHF